MSKYYNLKKFNPDKKYYFVLESKIDKIDKILYNSYERDCGIGKENYYYILRFITKQQKEIENSINKDIIREKIKELKERTKQEKTITFYCNSNDIARTVISNFKELLEEN